MSFVFVFVVVFVVLFVVVIIIILVVIVVDVVVSNHRPVHLGQRSKVINDGLQLRRFPLVPLVLGTVTPETAKEIEELETKTNTRARTHARRKRTGLT